MFDDVAGWFHLIAAAVWVGGLITFGALVAGVRRAGADRSILRAMAQQFGRVSWTAMGIAVVTGVIQLDRDALTYRRGSQGDQYAIALLIKLTLVGLAAGLALFHQLTAKTSSPAARGAIQGLILLSSLGIMAAAIAR